MILKGVKWSETKSLAVPCRGFSAQTRYFANQNWPADSQSKQSGFGQKSKKILKTEMEGRKRKHTLGKKINFWTKIQFS